MLRTDWGGGCWRRRGKAVRNLQSPQCQVAVAWPRVGMGRGREEGRPELYFEVAIRNYLK